MNRLLPNLSKIAIFICIGFFISQIMWDKKWNNEHDVIQSDVIGYYAYLPAIFIYNDISLQFVTTENNKKNVLIWFDTLPDGKRFIRYSVGQAILYLPFFLLGHLGAILFNADPTGYTAPYKFALLMSCLFYVFLGFLALRKLLRRYFPDFAVAITIIMLGFSTNLHHYVVQETTMTHAYSFALIAVFLLLTDNWFRKPNIKISILTGAIFGLLTLVRPFNGLVALFFIFYGISSLRELKSRPKFFIQHSTQLVILIGCVLLIWIPQLMYWKFVSGNYLFYSYDLSGGSFFFNQPKIIDGLFSYRKGWFTYNPIMILIIPGFFLVKKYYKASLLTILLFLPVFIYFLFSWWSWWYGGGFSIRSMVDIYAVYSIPLTASIAYLLSHKNKFAKVGISLLITFFLVTGFVFNRQYKKGIIHYDGMTKEAFWTSFYKFKVSSDYWDLICRPDYELARQGIYVCTYKLGKFKNMDEKPQKEF